MACFLSHLLSSRWFVFFASLLIMSVNGATYMFGIYSNDLKISLGYDQTTLNLVSFFKDLGGNLGIFSGLINEVTPPWVVLLIGAIMNFFGYFMVWLGVTGKIAKPRVWQMCLYFWIGADSQAFANTGSLITCVKSFPESRGFVLGLLKGFVGLSGAIITQFFHAIYGSDSTSLILLIALLPAGISLFFLRTIQITKENRRQNELKVFYKLLYISLGLAVFLMVIIIVQNKVTFVRAEYIGTSAIVLVFLSIPLLVISKEEIDIWKNRKRELSNFSQLEIVKEDPLATTVEPTLPMSTPNQQKPASVGTLINCGSSSIFEPPERGEDYTILQALVSLDMLLLFVSTSCGIGATLTIIDNLGQIGKSLGYPKVSISTFVSLVSIWNYLGRVIAGFSSEFLLEKYKIPRPLLLTSVLLMSCLGHLLIGYGVSKSLYFASMIIGFCFGAQWPLLFAIISDFFGLKYYSTLYQFGALASPIGAYLLNVKVAGHLYDKEALKQMAKMGLERKDGQDLNCNGVECYKLSCIIITCATLFGCVASFILTLRTRKFYRGDIYKRFRENTIA